MSSLESDKHMNIDLKSEEGPTFGFWKNLFFVVIFFTITPITLGVSLFSIFSFSKNEPVKLDSTSVSGIKVYASLPKEFPTILGEATMADARVELVRQYLERYNSPLIDHSEFIVEMADKYGIDFKLIPAIAQQESNLCKVIPPNTFNCWGWGIHDKGTLGFESYEVAIETVTAGLKKEYIDKGYNTPEKIMSKYTPLSNGSWALGVNQFIQGME